MGITYGDYLIDSGYYDITPEQECEVEARKECARRGIDPDEICADGGVTAWMVVDQERATGNAGCGRAVIEPWRECCDLAATEPCVDCPQAAASKICLTKFEEILLRAAKAGLNYIANTEAELGIILESGDLLRDAIGKIESYIDGGRSALAQSEEKK